MQSVRLTTAKGSQQPEAILGDEDCRCLASRKNVASVAANFAQEQAHDAALVAEQVGFDGPDTISQLGF